MPSSETVTTEWLDLGGGLSGFYARPTGPGPFPAVLLFIEAFGVNAHFKALAQRFAAAGYGALVPDIYHGDVFAYDDMEHAIQRLRQMDDATIMAETGRALDGMQARPEIAAGKVGVVGFCMGGRLAFLANADLGGRVAAVVAFYGGGIAPVEDRAGRKPLLDRAGDMAAPLMLLYGAKDGGIDAAEHGRICTALSAAEKRFAIHVFPDAGHGFFCADRPSYAPAAAAESWDLMADFFARHLGA